MKGKATYQTTQNH